MEEGEGHLSVPMQVCLNYSMLSSYLLESEYLYLRLSGCFPVYCVSLPVHGRSVLWSALAHQVMQSQLLSLVNGYWLYLISVIFTISILIISSISSMMEHHHYTLK
jgi:hypothetical protein